MDIQANKHFPLFNTVESPGTCCIIEFVGWERTGTGGKKIPTKQPTDEISQHLVQFVTVMGGTGQQLSKSPTSQGVSKSILAYLAPQRFSQELSTGVQQA